MLAKGLLNEDQFTRIQNQYEGLRELAEWWDNIRVMPRTLHTDRGSDFTSKMVHKFAEKYNIDLNFRPVGGAQYGGHVERFLKTINWTFDEFAGATASNPQERGDYESGSGSKPDFD